MAGLAFTPKDRFEHLDGVFKGVEWSVSVYNYADNPMLFFCEARAGLNVARSGPYEYIDAALNAGCWHLDKMLPNVETGINLQEVE